MRIRGPLVSAITTGPATVLSSMLPTMLPTMLATMLTGALLAGCQVGGAGPEQAAGELVEGLGEGDVSAVSPQAQESYEAIIAGLGDDVGRLVEVGEVTEADGTATAGLQWTWQIDDAEWTYDTEATLTETDGEWQVEWSPTIVEPSLEDGEVLGADSVAATRGEITGAGGRPIVTPRPVSRYGLDKTRVKGPQIASSARAIAQALDIDAGEFVERARAMGEDAFVEALVLRAEEAVSVVPASYARIRGAVVLPDEIPLAPTSSFAAPILGSVGQATAEVVEESEGAVQPGDEVGLSGLQARYDEQLRGTRGLRIEAVADEGAEDGAERALHEVEPVAGEPLRTTLDAGLQQRAERALAQVGPASALVAIRPSDGAILAAASGPGSEGINTATYGQYAPGSTFKVVTSLALLRSGLEPGSAMDCPATTVVDGKSFKNYDDYPSTALGRIDLSAAVANSCNTAFIEARDELDDGALADAAAALGLGVDHDLGFPAYFGQVPPPESETEAAADLIGQGTVLASPMSMATVAASVTAGRTVLPTLLPDHEVKQEEPRVPLTGAEATALRGLMRGVVTSGSGSALAPFGQVIAKTGTAEYGEPRADGSLATHAWLIAARGDLAVAAFVETGESGSQTAGPVLVDFLS